MLQEKLRCPECGSTRLWRAGIYYATHGTYQRYLCRDCGFRFSEASLRNKPRNKPESAKFRESEGIQKIHTHSLKTQKSTYNCQICVWKDQTKNLAPLSLSGREKSLSQQQAEQKSQKAELRGKIIEFLWWMKKQGYAEQTIKARSEILQRLIKLGADLSNPDSIKEILAKQKDWSPGRKANVIYAYALFAKWLGIEWEPPRIRIPEKLPFIPMEREIDDLIAGCTKYIAAALQIAKETAARVGEIFKLKWVDVDFENRVIRIAPEKGSKPRAVKVSFKLIQMLNALPRKGEGIFSSNYKNVRNLRRTFQKQRKKIANKLGNPRLMQIHFHTLRHWKATMEYYKTKDILHVMNLLGHKNIKNTLIYTQLVKFQESDDFICKVAKTPKEIAKLIEAGFEYVTEHQGLKFFRKRK